MHEKACLEYELTAACLLWRLYDLYYTVALSDYAPVIGAETLVKLPLLLPNVFGRKTIR